jgi:hypothetical protein
MKSSQKKADAPVKVRPNCQSTGGYYCPADNQVPASVREFRAERIHEQALTFFRWKHQAEWMFGEFWRTGRLKHLCAFVVHVVAMRARLISNDETRPL